MADKDVLSESEIRTRVRQDDTDRLRTELSQAFPSLETEIVAGASREELVDLVIACRVFLGQKTKVQEVLEGKFTLKLPKRLEQLRHGAKAKEPETVPLPSSPGTMNPADVMSLMMQMLQQQRDADEARRRDEGARRQEELAARLRAEEVKRT
jgi:hypothetical protein